MSRFQVRKFNGDSSVPERFDSSKQLVVSFTPVNPAVEGVVYLGAEQDGTFNFDDGRLQESQKTALEKVYRALGEGRQLFFKRAAGPANIPLSTIFTDGGSFPSDFDGLMREECTKIAAFCKWLEDGENEDRKSVETISGEANGGFTRNGDLHKLGISKTFADAYVAGRRAAIDAKYTKEHSSSHEILDAEMRQEEATERKKRAEDEAYFKLLFPLGFTGDEIQKVISAGITLDALQEKHAEAKKSVDLYSNEAFRAQLLIDIARPTSAAKAASRPVATSVPASVLGRLLAGEGISPSGSLDQMSGWEALEKYEAFDSKGALKQQRLALGRIDATTGQFVAEAVPASQTAVSAYMGGFDLWPKKHPDTGAALTDEQQHDAQAFMTTLLCQKFVPYFAAASKAPLLGKAVALVFSLHDENHHHDTRLEVIVSPDRKTVTVTCVDSFLSKNQAVKPDYGPAIEALKTIFGATVNVQPGNPAYRQAETVQNPSENNCIDHVVVGVAKRFETSSEIKKKMTVETGGGDGKRFVPVRLEVLHMVAQAEYRKKQAALKQGEKLEDAKVVEAAKIKRPTAEDVTKYASLQKSLKAGDFIYPPALERLLQEKAAADAKKAKESAEGETTTAATRPAVLHEKRQQSHDMSEQPFPHSPARSTDSAASVASSYDDIKDPTEKKSMFRTIIDDSTTKLASVWGRGEQNAAVVIKTGDGVNQDGVIKCAGTSSSVTLKVTYEDKDGAEKSAELVLTRDAKPDGKVSWYCRSDVAPEMRMQAIAVVAFYTNQEQREVMEAAEKDPDAIELFDVHNDSVTQKVSLTHRTFDAAAGKSKPGGTKLFKDEHDAIQAYFKAGFKRVVYKGHEYLSRDNLTSETTARHGNVARWRDRQQRSRSAEPRELTRTERYAPGIFGGLTREQQAQVTGRAAQHDHDQEQHGRGPAIPAQ